MKGIIVQAGKPKSIVLFNNGKIGAIPTPPQCEVGMLVSVKFNNRLKIILFALAAALLIGLGVFIGVSLLGRDAPPAANTHIMPMHDGGHGRMMRRWEN